MRPLFLSTLNGRLFRLPQRPSTTNATPSSPDPLRISTEHIKKFFDDYKEIGAVVTLCVGVVAAMFVQAEDYKMNSIDKKNDLQRLDSK